MLREIGRSVVTAIGTAIAVSGLGACSTPPAADPLGALVARHVAARGGASAIQATQGVEFRLELTEPSFKLQATYLSNRDGCMRIDVFDGDHYLQSEGVSTEGGWARTAGDAAFSPQKEGGTEILRHGIESPVRLWGLDELRGRGHQLAYAGPERIDGVDLERIRITYSDGYSAMLYLDPATALIVRIREVKPMHLAIDPTKQDIETQFSDYRMADGVRFPFFSREVNWKSGVELGHTVVRSVSRNTAGALAACRRPAAQAGGQ